MATIKTLGGMPAPRFGKHCYFSEGAVIVGDVEMGDDCTVWFNAVIRGDVHFVKIGNRKCYIYFTKQPNLHKFWFENAFNCLDFAYLATTRVVKTETKSSIAILCTEKAQYDVQHTRSYQDTTSQLTHDEALWLTEMLTSHYVAVEDDGDEEQILITDYKAETTDEPGAGNTLEFTWQYASVRFMLGKDEFTRIFTQEYKKPFA